MCLPAEVHAKGCKLLKTGADLSRLDGICFEVAATAATRSQQFQANQDLQEQSGGKLAKVRLTERYLSVSGSHTVSFVKSVAQGCTTDDPGLLEMCPNGQLSLEALVSGSSVAFDEHPFTQMVKIGWTWKVIRQEVENEFSDLPALIQQAQNSSHALASQMNEIEAAMQVAFWFQQCKDMAEAVKLTVASQPACSHYMETIGTYVRLYGGGEDFPVMKVLDGISKLYGSNACIGEEFMEHVTFLDFKDPETTFVWLRAGCLAANCTSPRSVDSISKFLVKSDLDKLKHAKIRADVKKGENLCSLAWETLCNGHLETDKKGITLMGRLLVRVVLVLTNKSGKGREQKVYANLEEVKDTFAEELSSLQNPSKAANPSQHGPSPATTQAETVVSLKVPGKRTVQVLSLCRLILGMAFFSLCRLIGDIAVSSLCRLHLVLASPQPLQAHVWHAMFQPLQAHSRHVSPVHGQSEIWQLLSLCRLMVSMVCCHFISKSACWAGRSKCISYRVGKPQALGNWKALRAQG